MRSVAGALGAVVLALIAFSACGGDTTADRSATGGTSTTGGVGNTGGAGNVGNTGGVGNTGNSGAVGGAPYGGAPDGGSDGAFWGGSSGFDAMPDAPIGCSSVQCVPATCQGKAYQCGDCVDNDGDGLVDSDDPGCYGPCHNSEQTFASSIPTDGIPCLADCYFDQDSGSGNDNCCWSHRCDPLEVPPDYPPEGSDCAYDPNKSPYCSSATCTELEQTQSATCHAYCEPLTPNGCDCFGCCKVPGASTPIWLGSTDANWNATCTSSSFSDPTLCKPCTIVAGCFNPCEDCELCLGKTELPPDCGSEQKCPPGVQACGLPGQACCPTGTWCITGCCEPVPS